MNITLWSPKSIRNLCDRILYIHDANYIYIYTTMCNFVVIHNRWTGIKVMHKWVHTTVSVRCDWLSKLWTPAYIVGSLMHALETCLYYTIELLMHALDVCLAYRAPYVSEGKRQHQRQTREYYLDRQWFHYQGIYPEPFGFVGHTLHRDDKWFH